MSLGTERCEKRTYEDLRLSKCGLGGEWKESARRNIKQMKRWKGLEKKGP